MATEPIRLKSLLQQRHWQTYRTFCKEYDKAAKVIDPRLKGSWPSRAQLHRWLSGSLKGLPFSDHCRILEQMFPGYSAAQLFEPSSADDGSSAGTVSSEIVQVFEAVAHGLDSPDAADATWEQAAARYNVTHTEERAGVLPTPISGHDVEGVQHVVRELGQRLFALKKVLRLSAEEVRLIAGVSGHLIELDVKIAIDVDKDGATKLTYRHELFNMSSKPVTRVARELWLEYTTGGLRIDPVSEGERRVAIQRVHDTPTLAKFACQISPAIQPGESGVIGYTCEGGRILDHLYWRQAISRYTRHLTMNLRHRGAGTLRSCSAVEDHPDGSEHSATEELLWDYDGDDVVITLTRDYLRPNQSVTLRWDVERAAT